MQGLYPANALSVTYVHTESIENSNILAQLIWHSRVLDHKRHRAYFYVNPTP